MASGVIYDFPVEPENYDSICRTCLTQHTPWNQTIIGLPQNVGGYLPMMINGGMGIFFEEAFNVDIIGPWEYLFYTIANVHCRRCGEYLGLYFVEAPDIEDNESEFQAGRFHLQLDKLAHIHGGQNSRVFLRGLSPATTEQRLVQYFQAYGVVLSTIVKRPRGFGFVQFLNASAADVVVFYGYHPIDGHLVEAEKAYPSSRAPGT